MATNNNYVDIETLHVAADWWMRMRAPNITEDTLDQWLDWTSSDERHLLAYERVTELGAQAGALDKTVREQWVGEFADRIKAPRRWTSLAMAASFVVVVGMSGLLAWQRFNTRETIHIYRSAVAENKDLVLPDGSKVALGGDSILTTRFTRDRRAVELGSGEAFFQVQHDQQHPFTVSAGDLSIEDIGTAFDVRRTGQRVTIVVTQGRVHIVERSDRSTADNRSLDAVAGQRVSYDPTTSALSVSGTTAEQATAWRNDRLEFINEPLGMVVANINRYSARPVRIVDTDLETLHFTGAIKTGAIDSWLNALPQVFPLQVQASSSEVTLRRVQQK